MKITALAGGVGGAKLAYGLAKILPSDQLTIIVNTGDDFIHFGLKICPDVDTVCYTLADLANSVTGWGLEGDQWTVINAIARLNGPTWFNLGDVDLATHLERTRRLQEGQPLSAIITSFCKVWGVGPAILPMTDDQVSTWVKTQAGDLLPFQEYFVHQQCKPAVSGFLYKGIGEAVPAPGVLEAITRSDLIVICPSNPWVSIGPILEIPNVKDAIKKRPVVAVSPIIGGQAVKGPASKMYQELGITPSALAVARHYQEFIRGFVIDLDDNDLAHQVEALGISTLVTNTLMKSHADRILLAEQVIAFGNKMNGGLDSL